MSAPIVVAEHGSGARLVSTGASRTGHPAAPLVSSAPLGGRRPTFSHEPLAAGLGALRLEVELDRHAVAGSARIAARLHAADGATGPERVDRVAIAFEVPCAPRGELAFLRNGWGSWSLNEVATIRPDGDAPFPSGEWLRGMHHAVGARSTGRGDWHESHTVSVAHAGDVAVLAGVFETGRQYALVNLRREAAGPGAKLELEIEWIVECDLEPGGTLELEDAWLALGPDPNRLLERFAEQWGRHAGARRGAPFQAGWCSWYHYFHDVSEDALLRNLEALAARRSELPISLVQLDDGYQRAIGDWLVTNEKFPGGLPFVAERIRDAGFDAGLWTAPFSAVGHSLLLAEHPEWALHTHAGDWLRGTLIPQWAPDGWCYALDPSHPGLIAHLESLYAALVDMGFSYQKLDFVYMASLEGVAHDPSLTRAERLARGFDAVRRGAGDDAFLLGCGCPMGPGVGRVDGMRIGPDVAPYWSVKQEGAIPGIEPALPATDSAIRSIATRLWMHRRLWLNDPDCLMVRRDETELSPEETATLAHAIAVSGGMVVFSDDVALLGDDEALAVRRTIETARDVDAQAQWGGARHGALLNAQALANAAPTPIEVVTPEGVLCADLNLGDAAVKTAAGETLAPHASVATHAVADPAIAVFCDFDGTFVGQDVGGGIVRAHLSERREDLWSRWLAGEIDAWTYYETIFDGFVLPEPDRLSFLETIELDPGARELIALCDRAGWPFEVLSDGFDANIVWLRARFGLDFAFRSNRLDVGAEGQWRIAPGGRNPACACGTGTCKRAAIEAFRAGHPGTLVVHVGDGMVSDLCGALAADRVFAKRTLAEALDRVGRAWEGFDTLADVASALAPAAGPG